MQFAGYRGRGEAGRELGWLHYETLERERESVSSFFYLPADDFHIEISLGHSIRKFLSARGNYFAAPGERQERRASRGSIEPLELRLENMSRCSPCARALPRRII